MRRSERGFSLLEVLVAVAVLALLYTALAEASIHGLRMEGDAGRRFEASLLADEALNELENFFRLGAVPVLGHSEAERGDFLVETDVEPFDAGFLVKALKASRRSDPRESAQEALFLATRRGDDPYLYELRVRVAWQEAGFERDVTRTTYGFDAGRAAEAVGPRGDEEEAQETPDGAPADGEAIEETLGR